MLSHYREVSGEHALTTLSGVKKSLREWARLHCVPFGSLERNHFFLKEDLAEAILHSIQSQWTARPKTVIVDGVEWNFRTACRHYGICPSTACDRIERGWPEYLAITEPKNIVIPRALKAFFFNEISGERNEARRIKLRQVLIMSYGEIDHLPRLGTVKPCKIIDILRFLQTEITLAKEADDWLAAEYFVVSRELIALRRTRKKLALGKED